MSKKKIKTEGGLSMPLYEINKNLINQFPPYEEEKLKDLEERINTWAKEFNNVYFMLLCNELKYYTLFAKAEIPPIDFSSLGAGINELFFESGKQIVSDENCKDHFEIWAKSNNETNVFLLFPYDLGVVTYGV